MTYDDKCERCGYNFVKKEDDVCDVCFAELEEEMEEGLDKN